MAPKIPAASYVRMSTDKQETSPEQQRQAIKKLADDHGYEIVATYQDLGISGDATEKRKDFRRMIADGATRRFSTILCWDQDRFGRFDLIEAGKWVEPLRNAGVSLHTVTGGKVDWLTLTGQLGYMASQMGKAQYLRDLSSNVRRGQDRAEQAGRWTRGFAPYGYAVDQETGKLVHGDPSEVRILRKLFERYAEGDSLRELCLWLTAQGVKTRRGNDWQQQSVRHTINNIVYRGHLAYGKSSASKYLPHGSPDGVRRDRPEEEWNVMTGTHEPLVSQELFDRCQKRREYNRKMTGPKGKNRFPLTGLLYCERCGSRMCGQVAKNQPGVRRYICLGYTQSFTKCERRTVKEAEVLPEVVKAIRTQFIEPLMGDATRSELRERMKAILLANESSVTQSRKAAELRLAKLDGELEQAVTALLSTSEDLRPLVEKRVRTIQDERDQLADEVSQNASPAAEQLARAEQRIDAAIGWLDRLEDAINTDYDEKAMHELLRQFVERITLDVERVPQGKRSKQVLRGGTVYFRSESLPTWLIPGNDKLASPLGRLCFEGLLRW